VFELIFLWCCRLLKNDPISLVEPPISLARQFWYGRNGKGCASAFATNKCFFWLWCMMIYSCDWFHRFPTGLLVNFRVPLKTIHFLYLRLIWPLSIKKYVLISEFSQIPVCVISRSLIKGVPFSMQTWVRWSKSCEKPHLMRARSENYHVHFMYCSKTGYMVRIDESCKQKLHHDLINPRLSLLAGVFKFPLLMVV